MNTVPGRVTIVVPTRNSGRTLRACLLAARRQRGADVEVIVVDNASTDDTVLIAGSVADRVETWGPERSAQRNRGASLGSGEFVVFVDSDQELTPEVAAQVVRTFRSADHLGVLVLPELSRGEGFFAICRAVEKRLYLGDASVEAGRAFRRSVFHAVGGYNEALLGAEDFDLPDRIEEQGWRRGRIEAVTWHNEGRVRLATTFRKKRYYGTRLPAYLASRGRSRSRLARPSLRRWPRLLVRDPAHAIGLAMLKLTDGAGLAMGAIEAWARPRS